MSAPTPAAVDMDSFTTIKLEFEPGKYAYFLMGDKVRHGKIRSAALFVTELARSVKYSIDESGTAFEVLPNRMGHTKEELFKKL